MGLLKKGDDSRYVGPREAFGFIDKDRINPLRPIQKIFWNPFISCRQGQSPFVWAFPSLGMKVASYSYISVNISALIRTPRNKTSTPFYTGIKAVPRPVRIAAHRADLGKCNGYDLIVYTCNSVKHLRPYPPSGYSSELMSLASVYSIFKILWRRDSLTKI